MGNNGAQIKRPYYDKYFGKKYFQTIGDDLGPNGNLFMAEGSNFPQMATILQQQQQQPYYVPGFQPQAAILNAPYAPNELMMQPAPLAMQQPQQQATQYFQDYLLPR